MVKVEGMLVGLLLASGVLLGMTGFLGSMASIYSFDDNSTVINRLSSIGAINNSVNTTQGILSAGQTDSGSGSDVWAGVWSAITQLFSLPVIFLDMIGELLAFNQMFMLPDWVGGLVYTLVILLIIYAILRSLRGGDT